MSRAQKKSAMSQRFRGLLPIVVDVETTGLQPETDGLLELAAVPVLMNSEGLLVPGETLAYQIETFPGARIDPEALAITGIDPTHPFRYAIPEAQALHRLFLAVNALLHETHCQRAVLVGHNAWFDLSFMLHAMRRSGIVQAPFHSFTTFDTATLAAAALGETVLARAVRKAKISFDVTEAHSAIYDAEKTAELFCYIINRISSASVPGTPLR